MFDFADPDGPRQIKVGLVGTDESLDALGEWLARCQFEVQAKPSNQPYLYPPFPGFDKNHSFNSRLIWNTSEIRKVNIPPGFARSGSFNEVVKNVVDLYVQEIDQVIEKSGASVVLCAPPLSHIRMTTFSEFREDAEPGDLPPPSDEDEVEEEEVELSRYDFHDLLKAKSLHLRTPLQLVLPATYDESKAAEQKKCRQPHDYALQSITCGCLQEADKSRSAR